MKKVLKISILALFLSASATAFAGGLYTNTNQSAAFARFMAREALTDIDAVYYNPAGLAMLSDGWYLSLTNQSAFQTRTITNSLKTLNHPEYKGEANAPFIPSFQLAWKTGKWAFSAGFGVVGGGGKAEFNQGLPSFEAPISVLPGMISSLGVPTTAYGVDIRFNGTSLCYGGQLGATYKINDMFAAFAGARVVYSSNAYEGSIRNITVNPTFPPLFNGAMVSAPVFFNAAAQYFTSIGDPVKAAMATAAAGSTADKYVDVTQSGWGVTPILGVNFNWRDLNIGVKYEFNTHIDVTNKTTQDDVKMFPDGAEVSADIPALLSMGASYRLLNKKVLVAVGYHHFFDKQAHLENDKQDKIDHGVNEYLWGIEWDAHKYFLVSAGGQFTQTGVQPGYQSDISHSFNSYSLGFGGAVKINEKMRVDIGYFFTNYQQASQDLMYTAAGQKTTNPAAKAYDAVETYDRTNNVFAIGFNVKF